MSTQITAARETDPRSTKASGGGLFSLYKPGQGYWTRLGTALGAAAVILFIAWFVFKEIAVFGPFQNSAGRRYAVAAGVAALLSLVAFLIMNGPRRAQFLIDTDSELKKVSWAGWSELLGSTRVVVFFMLLTALMLFIFDVQFQAFFHTLNVWHLSFAGPAGIATGILLSVTLLATGVGLLRGGAEVTRRSRIAGFASLIVGLLVAGAWGYFAWRYAQGAPAPTI